MATKTTAVVPTLGLSPLLGPCLRALRGDGGSELEIVVVYQGDGPGAGAENWTRFVDRLCRLERNLGFAAGTNRGVQISQAPFVATVNDDVVVEPGWVEALVTCLEGDPKVACAQGVNLIEGKPDQVDGLGVGWNRFWQAVQLGRGQPPPSAGAPCREIFGISATAGLYRRQTLLEVSRNGDFFDPRLDSYYEDVDLACRLRAHGYRAHLVPEARAHHAGSITGRQRPVERLGFVYGNRYLVLARLLGRSFWPRLPLMMVRDGVDMTRALGRRDLLTVRGVLRGWLRASRNLRDFAHFGGAEVPCRELRRFQP